MIGFIYYLLFQDCSSIEDQYRKLIVNILFVSKNLNTFVTSSGNIIEMTVVQVLCVRDQIIMKFLPVQS